MPLLNEDYIQDASDDEAGGSDKDKSPKKVRQIGLTGRSYHSCSHILLK